MSDEQRALLEAETALIRSGTAIKNQKSQGTFKLAPIKQPGQSSQQQILPIQKIQPPEIPKYPTNAITRPSLNSRNNHIEAQGTDDVVRSRNLDGNLRNKLLVLQSIKNQKLPNSQEEESTDSQESVGPTHTITPMVGISSKITVLTNASPLGSGEAICIRNQDDENDTQVTIESQASVSQFDSGNGQ